MKIQSLTLLKNSNTFRMFIPIKVEQQIRYICNSIYNDEWSGVLFYKTTGNFEDNTLEVHCEDIFLMDVGNKSYTEFEMSPEIVSYMTENLDLLECQIGLIHSHNTMPTFFSGTDTETLRIEGTNRNHFVSLIVNNEGNYSAAITRKIKSERKIVESYTYNTVDDNLVSGKREKSEEVEYVEYFNLNIDIEGRTIEPTELKGRIAELLKIKNTKNFKSTTQLSMFNNSNVINKPKEDNTKNSLLPKFIEDELDDELEEIPYGKVKFEKSIIKSLLLQLLTGSIIINNESKININQWVKGMSSLFDKRFGAGNFGLKNFRSWASWFVEYLCFYTEYYKVQELGYTEEESVAICAYDLIKELEKLPKNKYIDIYIELLNNFI